MCSKGERGTTVVYADRFIPYRERTRAAETGDEPDAIPFLKRFTVFNADQCEDLPADIAPPPEPLAENLILPQAEALIRATGADIRIGGNRAFYVPSADYIQVPPPSAFFEPINFHRTVCHELGHWSGAAHRLNRDLSGGFGSSSYAREELVAEMTGAFVCAALSIVPTVRHADYLGSLARGAARGQPRDHPRRERRLESGRLSARVSRLRTAGGRLMPAFFHTPRTALTWATLEEWFAGALTIEHRRASRLRNLQAELHLRALPIALVDQCSSRVTLAACDRLLRRGPTHFCQPPRGQRENAPQTALIVAIANRIAQLDRAADHASIGLGHNSRNATVA